MIKKSILISSYILVSIVSIVIFYYISEKNLILKNDNKSKVVKKKYATKEIIKEKTIVKREIKIELPIFIKNDLLDEGYDVDNFKKEDWELFLNSLKNDFMIENKNIFLKSIFTGNNVELFELMKNNGMNLNNYKNDLFRNAGKFDLETLKYLFENEVYDITKHGSFLLNELSSTGNTSEAGELLDYLSDNGIDVSSSEFLIESIRNYPIYRKNLANVLNTFDREGFDSNRKGLNYYELSARHDVYGDGINHFIDNYEFLSEEEKSNSKVLHLATNNKNISLDTYEKLLDKFNINSLEKHSRRTALMQAVQGGEIDKVKLLLEKKADMNMVDFKGKDVYEILENLDQPYKKKRIKKFLDEYKDKE